MRASLFITIWFVIFGAFSIYGYLHEVSICIDSGSEIYRLESAIKGFLSWGGLGIGLANCSSCAWLLLALVESRKLKVIWAVIINLIICTVSIAIPPFLMLSTQSKWSSMGLEPFPGEDALTYLIGISSIMLFVGASIAVLFIPCVIMFNRTSIRKPRKAGKT